MIKKAETPDNKEILLYLPDTNEAGKFRQVMERAISGKSHDDLLRNIITNLKIGLHLKIPTYPSLPPPPPPLHSITSPPMRHLMFYLWNKTGYFSVHSAKVLPNRCVLRQGKRGTTASGAAEETAWRSCRRCGAVLVGRGGGA
jgi:hypothetical protein